jgi:hypothetical protein
MLRGYAVCAPRAPLRRLFACCVAWVHVRLRDFLVARVFLVFGCEFFCALSLGVCCCLHKCARARVLCVDVVLVAPTVVAPFCGFDVCHTYILYLCLY